MELAVADGQIAVVLRKRHLPVPDGVLDHAGIGVEQGGLAKLLRKVIRQVVPGVEQQVGVDSRHAGLG